MNRFSLYNLVLFFSLLYSCSSDPDPVVDCTTLDLSLDAIEINEPSSCFSIDGSIQMASTGFSGPLVYRANNGAPNETGLFTNLGSGQFDITVEDANGCTLSTSITLSSPNSSITISNISSTFSGCGDDNASLEIAAEGGPNLSYSINGTTFQEDNIFENVTAGVYSVTVRDDVCQEVQQHRVLSGTSFSNDIETIIDSNCAVSGCHVAGTGRVDFSVFSNVQSEAGSIKSRTQSGNMPPGERSITQEQINLIACWVDDEALDN